MKKNVEFFVYGATILCPSCVNMPSSKDTEEWLRAAIGPCGLLGPVGDVG